MMIVVTRALYPSAYISQLTTAGVWIHLTLLRMRSENRAQLNRESSFRLSPVFDRNLNAALFARARSRNCDKDRQQTRQSVNILTQVCFSTRLR